MKLHLARRVLGRRGDSHHQDHNQNNHDNSGTAGGCVCVGDRTSRGADTKETCELTSADVTDLVSITVARAAQCRIRSDFVTLWCVPALYPTVTASAAPAASHTEPLGAHRGEVAAPAAPAAMFEVFAQASRTLESSCWRPCCRGERCGAMRVAQEHAGLSTGRAGLSAGRRAELEGSKPS